MLSRRILVPLAILIGGGLAGGVGAASGPTTISHYGLWTLRDFGYGDEVRYGTPVDFHRPMIYFGLPKGASQGPRDWYVVRLHMRLTLAADSSSGTVTVMASTDDASCALVEFKVKRTNGHPTIKWAGFGIVDGVTRDSSNSGVAELRYSNYLQESGIRPGLNTLDFQVGQEGSARISELRVFSKDSGIEYTPLSPANVTLDARLASKTPVHVGQRFAVRFSLRNDGERTARRIQVSADYDQRKLSLVRATSTSVTQLRAGRSVAGSFLFTALRSGSTSIFLGASTSSNHPGDDITLKIRPSR